MRKRPFTRADLAHNAICRTFFEPTSLRGAIERLGYVQADPIRAPARAQDLILRHRVQGYRVGDLELHYDALEVEEDYLLNYGFLPREVTALLHPRVPRRTWTPQEQARASTILAFIEERGQAHPTDVEAHFAHGRTRNAWGGMSRASTQLLDAMHYRGLLRIAGRTAGVRNYAPSKTVPLHLEPSLRAEKLLGLALSLYAPVPQKSLGTLASFLRVGAPHLRAELRLAVKTFKAHCPSRTVEGIEWFWPEGEDPEVHLPENENVRLLAPFDPLVWDRFRFELLWGWAYRFEAYTPVKKRIRGYYALPLLWRNKVVGWANITPENHSFGYVSGSAPQERAFKRELAGEEERLDQFLRPRPLS